MTDVLSDVALTDQQRDAFTRISSNPDDLRDPWGVMNDRWSVRYVHVRQGKRERIVGWQFRGIRVEGRYGWVDVDDGSYCFDPRERLDVVWRDGGFGYDSWVPERR